MSACGDRNRRRWIAWWRVGGAAVAIASSAALADVSAIAGPSPVEGRAPPSLLSPEAPPSLGDIGDLRPSLAIFNAPRAAENGERPLTDPATVLAIVGEIAPFGPVLRLKPPSAEAPGAATLASDQARMTPSAAPSAVAILNEARSDSPGSLDVPPPPVPEPSAAVPPPSLQTALKTAMERLVARSDPRNPLGAGDWRGARAAIAAFYDAREYAPVWVNEHGLTRAGRAALSQLQRAEDDGLDLSAFPLPEELGDGLAVDALAEAETTISAAVTAYAEQASGSRAPPSRISRLITAAPSVAEPGAALAETATAADPAARLADFNPPHKGYRALRAELKKVIGSASARSGQWIGGPMLTRGLGGARAAFTGVESGPYAALDDSLSLEARRRVKAVVPGGANSASIDAKLSSAAFDRRRAAILANMEMWRWEPRDKGERRIEVNVADFSVSVLEGDTLVHHARVGVGKPDTPTPIFSDVVRFVLINPSWQVPDSIVRKEMLPKLAADPDYLIRHGYEVRKIAGRITVRQPPGEDNALGRIAFMFPNEHSVYMHDTPSGALFESDMRAFSHGCLRVEQPLRLAELVLGGAETAWSAGRINAAIGGPERTVPLPRPLPIHIEYFTEFVDESGALRERPDVYGLTQRVAGLLSAASQD